MATYHVYPAELYHHGIKGMKWGVRRFQNKDGSLTGAGRKRYKTDVSEKRAEYKKANRAYRNAMGESERYSNRHFIGKKLNKKVRAEDERLRNEAEKKRIANDAAKKAYENSKANAKAEKFAANKERDAKIMDARKARNEASKELKNETLDYALSILSGDKTARKKAVDAASKSMDKYLNSKEMSEMATSGEAKVINTLAVIGGVTFMASVASRYR